MRRNLFHLNEYRETHGQTQNEISEFLSSQRLAPLMRESLLKTELNFDKIFAAAWISDDEVLLGTKCNQLLLLNLQTKRTFTIPLINGISRRQGGISCGIHCISINPSRTLLATGGSNPCHVAIYFLPQLQPVAVLEFHQDWIFSCAWIDDATLVSGSRDKTLALWNLEWLLSSDAPLPVGAEKHQNTVNNFPIYSLFSPQMASNTPRGKVRDTTVIPFNNTCAALIAEESVSFWDPSRLEMVSCVEHVDQESVCLSLKKDSDYLACGSFRGLTFFDVRSPRALSFATFDKGGVRSLCWNDDVLTVGGGHSNLSFFDVKMNRFLILDEQTQSTSFQPKHWRAEEKQAIYALSYDSSRVRLLAAGGPLPVALQGNYLALWS